MTGWPTIEEIKSWLGITGTEDDDWLTHKRNVTISLIDRYCNRLFVQATYIETHNLWNCKSPAVYEIFLKAQPVESVVTVTGAPTWKLTDYGTICLAVSCGTTESNNDAVIEYIGGFDPMPPEIIDVFYNMMNASYASKGYVQTGQIKKETIMGVVSTEYAVGTDNTAANNPTLPEYYASILDSYVMGKT